MKITKSSSGNPIKQELKPEINKAIGQGITQRLLEKYKPKDLCNIETISDWKKQKRAA